MGVKDDVVRLARRHAELLASGERSLARWQAFHDEIAQAYLSGQRTLLGMQRKLIERTRTPPLDASPEAPYDPDETFVALQDLASLRADVKTQIEKLLVVRSSR